MDLAGIARLQEQNSETERPWRYAEEYREDVSILERANDKELSVYFPGNRELSEKGAWVTVLRQPHSVIEVSFGDTYFARPFSGGVFGFHRRRYSVEVVTPSGGLRLWPYEYCVLPLIELISLWQDGELEFHPMVETAAGIISERLFYIQTRGIPLDQALPMALPDILSPVGWFSMKLPTSPPNSSRTRRRKS